jgi:hypothetical protein
MRQVIIFVVIAIVMSLLRRRQNTGTGTPTAPMPGRLFRMPEPPTASPSPPPALAPARSARPARGAPAPRRGPTPSAATRARQERMSLERIEQKRTDLRRRVEAEVANAAATAEAGPHTEMPGGIDPRLLDQGRTPQPTPTPLHPR